MITRWKTNYIEDQFDEDSVEEQEESVSTKHFCDLSPFKCSSEFDLRRHLYKKQGSLPMNIHEHKLKENKEINIMYLKDCFQIEIIEFETVYACNICNEGFENIESIRRHVSDKHEEVLELLEKEGDKEEKSSEDDDHD